MKNILRTFVIILLLGSALNMTSFAQLTGDYVIGTGQTYTTLGAAITALNSVGASGTVRFLIDENLSETGSPMISSATLNGTNTLVIKPNTGKTPTVTFSGCASIGNNAYSGLTIDGVTSAVGYVTIDGSNTNGGTTRDLTFRLNDATAGRYCINAVGNADYVIVKNCKFFFDAIMDQSVSANRGAGVRTNGTASTVTVDSVIIQNNEIGTETQAAGYGILINNAASTFSSKIYILDNIVYGSTVPINTLRANTGTSSSLNIIGNTVSLIGFNTLLGYSEYGIWVDASASTVNIARNKIIKVNGYNSSGTAYPLYGIFFGRQSAGSIVNIVNNFIGNFNWQGSDKGLSNIFGIHLAGTTASTYNIYYNSVYLNGNNLDGNTSTLIAFNVANAASIVNLKNNILVNTANISTAYAISSPTTTVLTSNYNDLYVSGSSAYVGLYNGVARLALANWRTASGQDANSFSVAAPFISVTDLHIPNSTTTYLESGGTVISGITTDIDNDIRFGAGGYVGTGTAPDIGADEFNGIKPSVGPPEIDWCNLDRPANGSITSIGTITVYAQVSVPGVTNSPGQGAGISAWIGYSTSNTDPSTWTNWIPATYNGDVSANDEYKADIGPLPSGTYYYASRFRLNLDAYKYGGYSSGGGGFWNGTTYISGTLFVDQFLTGDYYIPQGANPKGFSTLVAAISDINLKGCVGTVRFLIDGNLTETGSNLVINRTNFSATDKLIIKPTASKTTKTITISGCASTAGASQYAGLTLDDADYVTIDGSNTVGGTTRDLTFILSDNINGYYCIKVYGNADNVTIKNINVEALSLGPTLANSVGIFTRTATSAGNVADNLIVDNCQVGTSSSFYAEGIAIFNPSSPGTHSTGASVTNNIIHAGINGINLLRAVGISSTLTVSGNTVSLYGISGGVHHGLWLENIQATANINSNKFVTLKINNSTTGDLGGYGIYTTIGSSGAIVNIFNNFIGDFWFTGSFTGTALSGIFCDASNTAHNVYYNTVYLNSDNIGTNNGRNSALQLGNRTGLSVNLKNNILINTINSATSFGIDCQLNTALSESNYNDIYVPGASAFTGFYTSNQQTLTNWKTATSKDANSVAALVNFVSLTDQHLTGASIGDGNLYAAPIAGFGTDYDGQTRNVNWTYKGADENTSSPLVLTLNLKALIQGFYGNGGLNDTLEVSLAKGSAPTVKSPRVRGLSSTTGVNFILPKISTESAYYAVVNHRNSIETWSDPTVTFTAGSGSYDFTSAQSQAYGSNMILVGGKWCIFGGDPNQDGIVDISDVSAVDTDNLNFVGGYIVTDMNGDNIVDISDVSLTDINNLNFVGKQTPFIVKSMNKIVPIIKQIERHE